MCTYHFRCLPKTGYPGGFSHFFLVREQVLRALPRNAVSSQQPGPPGILEVGLLSNPSFLPLWAYLTAGVLPDSQYCPQSECAAHNAGRSQVLGPSPGDPLSEPRTAAGHCPYRPAKRVFPSLMGPPTTTTTVMAALQGEGRPMGGKQGRQCQA